MANNDIAISIRYENDNVDFYAMVDAIENAGFKNVFIQWYDNYSLPVNQQQQLEYMRKKGLNVIFAHLGYQQINDLWLDTEIGDGLVERYKNDIKQCKENGISLVIMHLTSKSKAPLYNQIGLKRIKEIVDYAKELDVKVAFENNKIEGYLEYVIDNIDNDNVGICFDSGHCHAHFNDRFNFDKFQNKIFAIHLHDNDRSFDQHLIPYDGTTDWNSVIDNLKTGNYNGPITIEVGYNNYYSNINIEEFYKRCYEIGISISNLYTQTKIKKYITK